MQKIRIKNFYGEENDECKCYDHIGMGMGMGMEMEWELGWTPAWLQWNIKMYGCVNIHPNQIDIERCEKLDVSYELKSKQNNSRKIVGIIQIIAVYLHYFHAI